MLGWLVLLFVVADAASLWLAWDVLRPEYGGWTALGLVVLYLFLAVVVGGWIIRAGGFLAGWHAIRAARRGASPTGDLLNGLLAFIAGLLVIYPGLVSDAIALVLLFPPTRALARRALFGPLSRRAERLRAEGTIEPEYRIE